MSDTHCGHVSGLTPPGWQLPLDAAESSLRKLAEFQRRSWDWFEGELGKLSGIDCVILNGDAVDGKAPKDGGRDLVTSDRSHQVAMAEEVLRRVDSPKVHMLYGTPYHGGRDEDWEGVLADRWGCQIDHRASFDIEGVVMDVRHKIGRSTTPYGRATPLAKARTWNLLAAERGAASRADIVVRSHVHYFAYTGDSGGLAMTTPALQGSTAYGARECEGTVDYGFITIDCEGGGYEWTPHLMDMRFTTVPPRRL